MRLLIGRGPSYRSHVGLAGGLAWLDTPGLLGYLLGHDAQTPADARQAARMYAQRLAAGRDVQLWDDALSRRVFLGDDSFVQRMQALMSPASKAAQHIPMRQRGTPKGLSDWLRECAGREEALWMAHTRSGLRMTALAAGLGCRFRESASSLPRFRWLDVATPECVADAPAQGA